MSNTDNPGIDYGLGQSNVDRATGIRYGVICIHDLHEWAWDEFEADYGDPLCPECLGEVVEYGTVEDDSLYTNYGGWSCADYACTTCRLVLGTEDVLPDEPLCWVLKTDEYEAVLDRDLDVFITKSPYFTHAQFCSPCAPGAGHLGHPCLDGPRTFCLDASWFEGDRAPYPVYRVDTGAEVPPAGADHGGG